MTETISGETKQTTETQSIATKAVKWLLRLSGVKALTEWTDGDILSWVISKDLVWDAEVPRWLELRHSVTEERTASGRFIRCRSRQEVPTTGYVFYLHGGGFLMEMYFLYWLFIGRLLSAMPCEVAVPLYPLLPDADMDTAYADVLASYLAWAEQVPPDVPIHLIGDSSGCTLALRLAQELRDTGRRGAANVVLISPWIDMEVEQNLLQDYEEQDPFISVAALKHCAELAVPSRAYAEPRYSPVYGDLHDLGRLTVYTGTADTLYPDARALYSKAKSTGVPINYYEHRNMFHIYPHFPIREGILAFDTLIEILTGNKETKAGFEIYL